MNYRVIQTPLFEKQIRSIIKYIKVSFLEKDALEYWNYLQSQVELLKKFPNMGKKVSTNFFGMEPTNAFISKKNIVFYEVNDTEKTIVLLIITNANQNYLSLMK